MNDNYKIPIKQKSWLQKILTILTNKPRDVNELLAVVQYAATQELINNETLHMLEGVVNIQELRVKDIMVPKTQMIIIRDPTLIKDIIITIMQSGYSRFPVSGENQDEILGILLAKDLLCHDNEPLSNIRDLLRPAVFIPENKRLDTLLQDFQIKRNHMAIVVDEYGSITGLITIEDVLEQIVGNIEDEHDTPDSPTIRKHGNHIYSVKAFTPIEEFNTFFNVNLTATAVETIGGLVMQNFGYLPKRGESIQIGEFNLKVLKADNRRIHLFQVIIEPTDPTETEPS